MFTRLALSLLTAAFASGQTIGQATQSQINRVAGLAVDASGNVYLADELNNRVRKVDTKGVITTFAGTGPGAYGGDCGPAAQAQLNGPLGLCVAPLAAIYVTDQGNKRVRKISHRGWDGGDGGAATSAGLVIPIRCLVDKTGSLFIAVQGAHRIRKVDANGELARRASPGMADQPHRRR